mmetsp:Transcript_65428/g.185565  ORF Transcript_65428/g.185565 Transcript_65428/m.185565 type:complete len:351 (+) Transcript_65428:1915-2967(+)
MDLLAVAVAEDGHGQAEDALAEEGDEGADRLAGGRVVRERPLAKEVHKLRPECTRDGAIVVAHFFVGVRVLGDVQQGRHDNPEEESHKCSRFEDELVLRHDLVHVAESTDEPLDLEQPQDAGSADPPGHSTLRRCQEEGNEVGEAGQPGQQVDQAGERQEVRAATRVAPPGPLGAEERGDEAVHAQQGPRADLQGHEEQRRPPGRAVEVDDDGAEGQGRRDQARQPAVRALRLGRRARHLRLGRGLGRLRLRGLAAALQILYSLDLGRDKLLELILAAVQRAARQLEAPLQLAPDLLERYLRQVAAAQDLRHLARELLGGRRRVPLGLGRHPPRPRGDPWCDSGRGGLAV